MKYSSIKFRNDAWILNSWMCFSYIPSYYKARFYIMHHTSIVKIFPVNISIFIRLAVGTGRQSAMWPVSPCEKQIRLVLSFLNIPLVLLCHTRALTLDINGQHFQYKNKSLSIKWQGPLKRQRKEKSVVIFINIKEHLLE